MSQLEIAFIVPELRYIVIINEWHFLNALYESHYLIAILIFGIALLLAKCALGLRFAQCLTIAIET